MPREDEDEPSVSRILKEAILEYGGETFFGFLGTLTVNVVFILSYDKRTYNIPLALAAIFSCGSFIIYLVYWRLEAIFGFLAALIVTVTFFLPYSEKTYNASLAAAEVFSLLSFAQWFKSIADQLKMKESEAYV